MAVGRRQAWRQMVAQRCWSPEGPEADYRPFARDVRRAAGVPTILVGGVRTTGTMTDILASGDADFVAMARPFIREPDLVRKLEAGRAGSSACHARCAWPMMAGTRCSAGATPQRTSSAMSASATGPTAATLSSGAARLCRQARLLPFDGGGGLRGDVVGHPVDSRNFVHHPAGDPF